MNHARTIVSAGGWWVACTLRRFEAGVQTREGVMNHAGTIVSAGGWWAASTFLEQRTVRRHCSQFAAGLTR
jgi:hypothetical protein